MFARVARAAQRALASTSRRMEASIHACHAGSGGAVAPPAGRPNGGNANRWTAARRTFAATMSTIPFAVEAGSQAAGYMGGLLNPADRARISSDLDTMPRRRIEGPHVPRARAVLVPLCHDVDGVPHALFTVRPDDFGAPYADFPGGARDVHDSDAVAGAVRQACAELGLDDASTLHVLGLTSDCPDVPRQTAVTPVVGYLGAVNIARLKRRVDGELAGALKGNAPTLMAMSLDHLLSKESIDAKLVPGVGPMPVFNASCAPGGPPMQIWGLTAQILHGVMRVVVGARVEYKDALYGPFMRKSVGN